MRTQTSNREPSIDLVDWLQSFPSATKLLVAGHIRLRHERLGEPLAMSDGRTYAPFRESVKDPSLWLAHARPAVLQPRFQLRGFAPDRRALHALFRSVCIATTPFFVGLEGFRSKLWMVDPATGDFAGLYEWDTAAGARAYARGLTKVLLSLSTPGSVSCEVVEDTTVAEYLHEHMHKDGREALATAEAPLLAGAMAID